MEEIPKNYYQTKERKFTFLNLEVRSLDGLDIFSLCLYGVAVIGHFSLQHIDFSYKAAGIIAIPFTICFLTITTPFGLRFKNVYFFLVWFLLSCVFLLAGTSLSYLPIGCFVLYQLIRLFFWRKYHKEFIPFEVVRGFKMYRFVSKNEGRGGYREDKHFMKWLFWLGAILFFCCLFGMVGVNFKA